MPTPVRVSFAARVAFLSLTCCACGGIGEQTAPAQPTQLFVHSRALTLLVGDTVTVGATRRAASGSIVGTEAAGFSGAMLLPDAAVHWRVRESNIATVSPTGAVRALAEGTTTLVVTDGELTDSTTITIQGADVYREYSTIKVGIGHACAIDLSRALWCWGGSWSGQLGTGERLRLAHYVSPQRISLPEHIIDVAVGGQHTCALGARGSVYCAGDNLSGQIAGSSGEKVLRFEAVALAARVTAIESSGDDTCGITTTGGLHCWGGFASRALAAYPAPAGTRFVSLSMGPGHRCALSDRSQLYCWGNTSGSAGTTPQTPTLIAMPTGTRAVSTGAADVCVIDEIGSVFCWQPGARREVTAAQRIGDAPTSAAISAHGSTRCVLRPDGEAWCWGIDTFGALGRGGSYSINQSVADLTFPVPLPVDTDQRFVRLTGNGGAFCGLTARGRAYCWGNNRNGLLGIGMRRRSIASITTPFSPLPLPVR